MNCLSLMNIIDLDNVFERNFMVFRIYLKSSIKSCFRKVNQSWLQQIRVCDRSIDNHLFMRTFSGVTLSNEDIDYLIEILKTLYNLTVDLPNLTHSYAIQEEEEEAHLMRLVSILRELLLCYGPNDEKQMELRK